jgi:hypothetical protein
MKNTTIWLGALGLLTTLSGCPGDDGGGDDGATSPTTSTTDAMDSSGGTPTTATATATATAGSSSDGGGDSSSSSGGGGDSSSGGGGDSSSGGGGDSSSGGGSDSSSGGGGMGSDYGPCDACAAGEMPVQIGNIPGCFCSPSCDELTPCPDVNEGIAVPMCVLELMMGAGPTQCALICTDNADCPTGATCEDAGGGSVCMHPEP